MTRPTLYAEPRPREPETPARQALEAWLDADPARTQERVGDACGVAQQSISSLLKRKSRPSEALAKLLEATTHGVVLAGEGFTTEERHAQASRLAEAALAGAAMTTVRPV